MRNNYPRGEPLDSDTRALLIALFIVAIAAAVLVFIPVFVHHLNEINRFKVCLDLVSEHGLDALKYSRDCAQWATGPVYP